MSWLSKKYNDRHNRSWSAETVMFYVSNMWSTTTGEAPAPSPYSGYMLRRGGRRRMLIPFLIPFLMLTITIFWSVFSIDKSEWDDLALAEKTEILSVIKGWIIAESPGCTGGEILVDETEYKYYFHYKCKENGT